MGVTGLLIAGITMRRLSRRRIPMRRSSARSPSSPAAVAGVEEEGSFVCSVLACMMLARTWRVEELMDCCCSIIKQVIVSVVCVDRVKALKHVSG